MTGVALYFPHALHHSGEFVDSVAGGSLQYAELELDDSYRAAQFMRGDREHLVSTADLLLCLLCLPRLLFKSLALAHVANSGKRELCVELYRRETDFDLDLVAILGQTSKFEAEPHGPDSWGSSICLSIDSMLQPETGGEQDFNRSPDKLAPFVTE
jgi:hypothetical protein